MNIMVIGAHPDDCEFFAAGTAVKFVKYGHRVKFVSVTNGDAGHMTLGCEELAGIRRQEIAEADDLLGVEWCILDNHDGQLSPDITIREELIRLIRQWNTDIVMSHRPWDYHPDHRNTAILVQDTAYLVIVPNICPDTPALKHNPVYLYLHDEFKEPVPFRPDVIVPIDDVFPIKVKALHIMKSQFYEWLPYTFGTLGSVPADDPQRVAWLESVLRAWMKNPFAIETEAMYGIERAGKIEMIEAFQVCPFGRQLPHGELRALFPFLPESAE